MVPMTYCWHSLTTTSLHIDLDNGAIRRAISTRYPNFHICNADSGTFHQRENDIPRTANLNNSHNWNGANEPSVPKFAPCNTSTLHIDVMREEVGR
jgi:hypothetical protein